MDKTIWDGHDAPDFRSREALLEENERLRCQLADCVSDLNSEEIAKDEKDAERYRWLERQMISYVDNQHGDTWAKLNWLVGPASLSPATLGEAIDAAIGSD